METTHTPPGLPPVALFVAPHHPLSCPLIKENHGLRDVSWRVVAVVTSLRRQCTVVKMPSPSVYKASRVMIFLHAGARRMAKTSCTGEEQEGLRSISYRTEMSDAQLPPTPPFFFFFFAGMVGGGE